MTLDRETLLQRHGQRRYKTFDLQNGDQVRARSLTLGETRRLMRLFIKGDGEFDTDRGHMFGELLIGYCLVGEDDEPLFSQDEVLEGALSVLDAGIATTLINDLRAWTGVAANPDYQAVEDAVKNSETASTPGSSSDSQTAAA